MRKVKKCSKCNTNKSLTDFFKDKYKKDGLTYTCKSCSKKYYKKNRDYILERTSKYSKENRDKIRSRETVQKRRKYANNLDFKIACLLRSAVKRVFKECNTTSLNHLGCTIQELKIHLELQFTEGMTWDNHGEWHIDHIIPISWFIKNSDRPFEANKYTNLQPLWAEDNLKKGGYHQKR